MTNFELEGCSNYALNLITNEEDNILMSKITKNLEESSIEFRVGSAGGGNQLRQPYLKKLLKENEYLNYPKTEHMHFYGMYIGNYPELGFEDIDFIISRLNV